MNNIYEGYLKYLGENFNKGNNFIEYFITIGVKPDIFHNKWLYNTPINELNTIHQSHLQPQILSKFPPPITKSSIDIDDSIMKYCFPKGFSVLYFDQAPNPTVFSFILDNNYYSIEYPRKYISCLICYESLLSYKELYDEYHENDQAKAPNELNGVRPNNFNRRSSWTVSEDIYAFGLLKSNTIKVNNFKKYYLPKYLLIASLYPFFLEYERILMDVYDASLKIHSFPLYKYIENIVLEIPVPPNGLYTIEYCNINGNISEVPQNRINELPLIHVDLKLFFEIFNANDIINVVNSILLDIRVLVFCSDCSLLNPFIFGLISLLYPFEYQYQIVTILPYDNYSILESITPFIIGINQKYDEDFFKQNAIAVENIEIIIVDIDWRCLYRLGEENSKDRACISFPKEPRAKLERDLNAMINNLKEKNQKKKSREEEDIYLFNNALSSLFFNFYAVIMDHYVLYLNPDFFLSNENMSIASLFKVEQFLSQISLTDKPFYHKLITDTQIFPDLLFKRMIPRNPQDRLRILLFDERIQIDSNMTEPMPKSKNILTNSNKYDFILTYTVPQKRGLSDYEREYFNDVIHNKLTLLNQGVIIINSAKAKNRFLFKTPIFAILLTEQFISITYSNYIKPACFIDQLESIHNDIISQAYLNKVATKQTEIENNIAICWILLWAMTLWYQDANEKRFRFFQLLGVIQRLNYHDMNVINLLFDSIIAYGDEGMLIKLYLLLLRCSLQPNYKIYSIIMKLIDNKHISMLHQEMTLNPNETFIFEETFNRAIFKKRTFKTKYRPHLLNDTITFSIFDQCPHCNSLIEIHSQCDTKATISKDNLWAICPKCNLGLIPKLSIRLGDELNTQGNLIYTTSAFECVELYSPLHLKEKLKKSLMKDFGTKLDLEEFSIKTYSSLFWSSIWFFSKAKLPYDFMLLYEDIPDVNLLFKVNSHITIEHDHIDGSKTLQSLNQSFKSIDEGATEEDINKSKQLNSSSKRRFRKRTMCVQHLDNNFK